MKKIPIILLMLYAVSNCLHAEDISLPDVRLVFIAEDAKGLSDTIMLQLGADTMDMEINPYLGEVNLYSVPPEKDLDMRFIQRTDTTCLVEPSDIAFWLCPALSFYIDGMFMTPGISSQVSNIDLKRDFRMEFVSEPGKECIAIKTFAKNYPVKLFLNKTLSKLDREFFVEYSFFDSNNKEMRYCVNSLKDFELENEEESSYTRWGSATLYTRDTTMLNLLLVKYDEKDKDVTMSLAYKGYTFVHVGEEKDINPPYPNPGKEFINIEGFEIGRELVLCDCLGNEMKHFKIESVPYKLDISKLERGIYFIKDIQSGKSNKFIKE